MAELISTFKERFSKAMSIRAITPTELKDKTGISLATISQYTSGYSKPKTERTNLIANALSVDPAWLMGFDVPMERNDYEDPRITERDNILENIEKILKTKSWSLSCDTYDDDYFAIKNTNGQTIIGLYDYELISRYRSLKKKGKVTADLLVSSESAFKKYLESLGYYIGRDDPEHKPFIQYENGAVMINDKMLDDIRTRIDTYAKATIDTIILKLNEEELRKKRKEKERFTTHLLANAAHTRTDIDIPEGVDTSEDDIMDDENF